MRIIQIASSHLIGLTSQETNLAIAYSKIANLDILVLSGENEQHNGLNNDLAKKKIRHIIINGLDRHQNLFNLIKIFQR